MQTKVTVIGHKNTMLHNLCPIRESNWSTESTCLKSLTQIYYIKIIYSYVFLATITIVNFYLDI